MKALEKISMGMAVVVHEFPDYRNKFQKFEFQLEK